MISYYSLIVFLVCDIFHMFAPSVTHVNFPLFFLLLAILIVILLVPFGMHFGDLLDKTKIKGAELFMMDPSLGKKVYHESGIFYMEYNRKKDEYSLYYDRILYKMPIKVISNYDLNNNRLDGKVSLSHYVNQVLNNKYKALIDKQNEEKKRLEYIKEREGMLKNWDGHTSIQTKRDVLIDEII